MESGRSHLIPALSRCPRSPREPQPQAPAAPEESYPMPAEPTPTQMEAAVEGVLQNYDPLRDVAGPVQIIGDPKVSEPTLAALSPEMREGIEAKLANVPLHNRDEATKRFIREALETNSVEFRVMAGGGEHATNVQRFHLEKANQLRLLGAEHDRITVELADVSGWDPKTGEPIHIAQGDRRSALEARLREIGYHADRINGREGEVRLQEALEADKAQLRENQQALADMKEADALADEIVRKERIQRMAEAKARMKRPTGD